jgi:hypothetical protein
MSFSLRRPRLLGMCAMWWRPEVVPTIRESTHEKRLDCALLLASITRRSVAYALKDLLLFSDEPSNLIYRLTSGMAKGVVELLGCLCEGNFEKLKSAGTRRNSSAA